MYHQCFVLIKDISCVPAHKINRTVLESRSSVCHVCELLIYICSCYLHILCESLLNIILFNGRAGGFPSTFHQYDDVLLMRKAKELGMPYVSGMVEYGRTSKQLQLVFIIC